MFSKYDDKKFVAGAVKSGRHRDIIGGMWSEMGQLQLAFLAGKGLKTSDRLLDIGCGSLRGGVHFVRYLDADNYYGIDLNVELLDAGYDVEIASEGLAGKLPRSNLMAVGDFDVSWAREPFDFALAQSVFTHLPLNHFRICLERLSQGMRPGGRFYATFFEIPPGQPTFEPHRHEPGGITTHGGKDPYHYRFADIEFATQNLPWSCTYIGEWNHPRAQRMVEFIRQ